MTDTEDDMTLKYLCEALGAETMPQMKFLGEPSPLHVNISKQIP